jgi:hypothetical protein
MTPAGPALLMARLRVIARAQQQQQQYLRGVATATAPASAAAAAARSSPAADAATASSVPLQQAREDSVPATKRPTADSLPPGASPLLPAPQATAIAARLSAAGAFSAPPRSLSFERGVYRYPPSLEGNALGRAILRLTGSYSRRQTLRNGAVVLWDAISELAPRPDAEEEEDSGNDTANAGSSSQLAQAFGLEPRAFMTGWYLESLGVWLVINRLKLEGRAEAADFQQHLYSHLYQPEVARRVRRHPGVVAAYSGKWLRRLEQVFYGMALAYDRAIVGGDGAGGVRGGGEAAGGGAGGGVGGGSVGAAGGEAAASALSRALVRNVYGGDGAYAPSADLLARYLCRQLQCLAMTPTEDLYLGQVRFGGLEGPREGVRVTVPPALVDG